MRLCSTGVQNKKNTRVEMMNLEIACVEPLNEANVLVYLL